MLQDLSVNQRRQQIDTAQIYEAWRSALELQHHSFAGSMRWAKRDGKAYLLRKIGPVETSLGRESEETQKAYEAFEKGREENRERLNTLSQRLDEFAPINRAMGLGRVPQIVARILRRLDEQGLLGDHLIVVGTNALFAFEALAGAHIETGLLATGDIDMLFDARRRLRFTTQTRIGNKGLVGILQGIDKSFRPERTHSFRASNSEGFLVDFIRPQARRPLSDKGRATLNNADQDLVAAPIEGLEWLANAPKIEAVAIDEKGYPARIVATDPRFFAIHKNWLSKRPDRDPIKRKRDVGQARAASVIAADFLQLKFDDEVLHVLPRDIVEAWRQSIPRPPKKAKSDSPNW